MTKMNELLAKLKKAEEEKQCNKMKTVLAIIGVIVVIAGIAFAVYKFMTKCKKELECCDCTCEEDNCIEIAFVDPEGQEAAADKEEAAEKTEAAASAEEAANTDAAEE